MLLRKRAKEMVDLMEKTKAELASSNENINGDIHIGCKPLSPALKAGAATPFLNPNVSKSR